MIHDGCCDHEGINGIPWGMKSDPKQFRRFPYYEQLQIAHMFDTMHIRKNVTKKLWWILDLRSDKEKIVKICKDIQEENHARKDIIQFHSNGDQININSLPWMVAEQQSNVIKYAMQKS